MFGVLKTIMYNFKTKKNHLAKAITLASLFVVSSAQAVMINQFIFCPDGTSMSKVTQYEYIYKPTVVWRYLSISGGSVPSVQSSTTLELGSWYSELPLLAHEAPVGQGSDYRYSMITVSEPGFVNMSGFDHKVMKVSEIVPTGDYLDNGSYNFFPECQVDVTYL